MGDEEGWKLLNNKEQMLIKVEKLRITGKSIVRAISLSCIYSTNISILSVLISKDTAKNNI